MANADISASGNNMSIFFFRCSGIAEKTDRIIVSKPGIDKCFRNNKMVTLVLKSG